MSGTTPAGNSYVGYDGSRTSNPYAGTGGRRRTLKAKTLRRMLKKAGLKTTGKKATLRARVKKAHLRGGALPGMGHVEGAAVAAPVTGGRHRRRSYRY